jgi:putative addiction module CopG family antidote
MRSTQQMSITLPVEMARMVKQKVTHGGYASESEVIREGLRALQERDSVVERWLHEQVAPAYDAMQADPSQLIDAETAFADLHTRHAERMAKSGK